MKHSFFYILGLSALLAISFSCRKSEAEILTPSAQLDYRYPSEQFLSIWNSMNTGYAMWDLEEKDWGEVKDKYLPEFLSLDDSVKAKCNISTKHLRQLYKEILGDLKDHHSAFIIKNLWTPEGKSEYIQIAPASYEIKQRDYYHADHIFSYKMGEALQDKNLADKYGLHSWEDLTMVAWLRRLEAEGRATDINYGSCTGNFSLTIVSGLIDGNIPYLHISDFNLTNLFDALDNGNPSVDQLETYRAYESFKNNVLELDEVKGVIIDLRENGGGYYNDEFYLLGLLIDQPVQMGWNRYKSGLGRFDYSPWVPIIFSPGPEHRAIDGPVVIVSDLYSISMSEISVLMAKAMPNGCIIGERTYGAHGTIDPDFESSYSGSFGDREGNHYGYLSTRVVKANNGEILESIGVTPDIELDFTQGKFKNGEDTWLDRSVEYINTGR